jgi:hypothetical protein
MTCLKCGSVNRKGVKFCEECGAKLESECPACKTKLPLGKKFCGECGRALIGLKEIPAILEEKFVRAESELLIEEIDHASTTHQQRVKISDRLAEIVDPRPGVGFRGDGLPHIVWCEVLGGKITLEKTGKTFTVDPFYISKYPVTWMQYTAAFLRPKTVTVAKNGGKDRQKDRMSQVSSTASLTIIQPKRLAGTMRRLIAAGFRSGWARRSGSPPSGSGSRRQQEAIQQINTLGAGRGIQTGPIPMKAD